MNNDDGNSGDDSSSGSNHNNNNGAGTKIREVGGNLGHDHETNGDSNVHGKDINKKEPTVQDEGDEMGGDAGGRYWLMTTDILREIIDGGLATATVDVKSNLIKAMNNLMLSDERRAVLVSGDKMSTLFALVHGYTPEVRSAEGSPEIGLRVSHCDVAR